MNFKSYLLSPRFTFNRLQLNLLTVVLLWIGVVGGSYLTLNKIIKSRATNDTTKTWLFNSSTATDYSTTNVLVNNFGARPSESNNLFTNYSFDENSSNWTSTAIAPSGWSVVPGNSTFNTSDFLIMKYEAKALDTQTSSTVFDGGTNSANSWAGIKGQTRFQAVSVAQGRPWVTIAQVHATSFDANDACKAVNIGSTTAHLINNNEWMTVARNAESVNLNWTSGTVGLDSLVRGNSNSSLSMNGFNPLNGVNRRTHYLTNGEIVWDLAGNVYDWTNDIQTTPIDTTTGWVEWDSANIATGARELYGSSNSNYLSTNGVGRVSGGSLGNGFIRGSSWGYGTSAGIFTLNLVYSPSTNFNIIGFRCATDSLNISQSYSSNSTISSNNSFIDSKLVQTVNVGDSASYDLSVFVYNQTSGNEGGVVDDSVAIIYANGSTYPSTQYTNVDNGWYKLSATVIGSSAPTQYGIAIKSGKSVKTDDFNLTKSINRFDNPSFDSNNNSWLVGAVSGSSTPNGWVVAPGDSRFGTSDFLVMKYEAKAYDTQTSTVVTDGGVSVLGWAGIKGQTRYQAVSTAEGRPWVNIAQIHDTNFDATEACNAISLNSSSSHIISNNQWMTIANNVSEVNNNWTGNIVGSGSLVRGNSDSGVSMNGLADLTGVNKRTLTLNNGEIIWDFSGNAYDLTSDTILRKDMPYSWNGSIGSTGWVWNDFESGASSVYLKYYKIGSSLQQKDVEPLNFSYPHNANYGLGRMNHYSLDTDTSTTVYGITRGECYDSSGTSAGAFAIRLAFGSNGQSYKLGFRCASDSLNFSKSFQSISGRNGSGGQKIVSDILTDTKIYQSLSLGDTDTYIISAYVYDETNGNIAGPITSDISTLYADHQSLATEYTDVGNGWWKLSAAIVGSTSVKEYGVLVKAGKTVDLDDFSLNRAKISSIFNKTAYFNAQVSSWDSLDVGITSDSNSVVKYQFCTTDGTTCEANIGTSNPTWQYWNGSSWTNSDTTISTANSLDQLTETVLQSISVLSQKISIKVLMTYEGDSVPILGSLSLGLTTDITAPTNASSLIMHQENSSNNCIDEDNCWTKLSSPTFSWNPGSDNDNGSGLKGYCLYLGTDSNGNPANNKGKLGTSPVSITNTPCQFIVASSSLDLSTANYLASALSNSDNFDSSTPNTYFLNLKAVDIAGNTSSSSLSIRFRYDGTTPTNVTYISPASGSFSNVSDMSFSWPNSDNGSAIDNQSGILGWQYQINSTTGSWLGSTTSPDLGIEYLPVGISTYHLTSRDIVQNGNNVVYFRTVDKIGNFSDSGSIRTGNLSFGGDAPTFSSADKVTITPDNSESNSFSLSWPSATASNGKQVSKYYYMINVNPPSTLDTLQGNISTYIDNGNSATVSASALPNVNKGTNTVYVVAIDDETTPNYSPSNYISANFTLNSNIPDNVGDLVSSDSSIKAKSQWNVTLTWTAPVYQGAGNLVYQIYRSTNNIDFSLVGTSSGLSYVDSAPTSKLYYYKVYTKDGASAVSSGTNTVSITPTGKWTSAPSLSSGPGVNNITTRKASITWSTSRESDSKIQFGTTSGNYIDTETSNSSQVTSHSIQLTGLLPSSTYFYKTKWTDEDGNTGISDEKSFNTQATPNVKDVTASGINLDSATIQFTSNGASKVKVYYGTTTSFGGLKSLDTSTSENIYTINLIDLNDGTKYYYKINTIDSDGYEYEGTVLDFNTLPRPRISDVQLQEITGTAQTTLKITWTTNTAISSIITFSPEGDSSSSRDQVKVDLLNGKHEMTITGLLPQTNYYLVVKGTDAIGNQAISDAYKFTTASDSRPPSISAVKVEGSTIPSVTTTGQESTAQLIITWNTDEPATSQVEFGEGTGSSYSQKTQEDTNLTTNHLVIISNLTPSKVYHLRTISQDKASNLSNSIDTVTITPKATDNALDLVVTNLSQIFSFLGGIIK